MTRIHLQTGDVKRGLALGRGDDIRATSPLNICANTPRKNARAICGAARA